jgi:hypothetical protein
MRRRKGSHVTSWSNGTESWRFRAWPIGGRAKQLRTTDNFEYASRVTTHVLDNERHDGLLDDDPSAIAGPVEGL